MVSAAALVAEQLRLPADSPVVRVARVRYANDEPMSLEVSFYPYERFPLLADLDLADRSIYRVLQETYDVVPAYAVDTTELGVAGPYEARELGVKEGTPMVLCSRASYLADDTPIEFTQTIHRGDRFRSVVRVTHSPLTAR